MPLDIARQAGQSKAGVMEIAEDHSVFRKGRLHNAFHVRLVQLVAGASEP
jgi:hypothetical protein